MVLLFGPGRGGQCMHSTIGMVEQIVVRLL
jgi:hypothetical protein